MPRSNTVARRAGRWPASRRQARLPGSVQAAQAVRPRAGEPPAPHRLRHGTLPHPHQLDQQREPGPRVLPGRPRRSGCRNKLKWVMSDPKRLRPEMTRQSGTAASGCLPATLPGEFVGRLQPHPVARIAPAHALQRKGHGRRDPRLAVQQPGQGCGPAARGPRVVPWDLGPLRRRGLPIIGRSVVD